MMSPPEVRTFGPNAGEQIIYEKPSEGVIIHPMQNNTGHDCVFRCSLSILENANQEDIESFM